MRHGLIIVVAVLGACGKEAKHASTGAGSGSGSGAAGAGSAAPPASAGAASPSTSPSPAKPAVLPTGEGPHAGHDLAAIHAQLQGTWLVGGSAFSTIPVVWSLDGDQLTTIREDGTRGTSTFRLLAPCYYFYGTPGGSGTYGTFVLDGATLYLGLGSAGVAHGDHVTACVAAGIYTSDGASCTLWRRKAFANPITWTSEPGECGYTADRTSFQGDDTNSSRKLYGVESLDVHGKVLLTKQMANNKAEKLPTLEAALARQQEQIAAKEALQRPPDDLPFKSWGLPPNTLELTPPARVWAAAVTRTGTWDLTSYRFKSLAEDVVWLVTGSDAWAPPAFVHVPDRSPVKAGSTALVGIGAATPYGRVVSVNGGTAKVRYRSGNRLSDRELELERILPIAAGSWTLGLPLAVKRGERWEDGRLVHATDAEVFVLIDRTVEKLPRSDVRAIDPGKRWPSGAKVWAQPDNGISPLVFVEGTIAKAEDGIYTIKTSDRTFLATADKIIKAL